ncbi:MAG: alpha/beta hydrolase [Anaerolineales bacterium]|nr:alpha/beta hydrolase [Anaerolineales bacterium]
MPIANANLNGLTVHYQVEGRGPDVLLIHGWGSSRRMWRHFISVLAPAYRCWSLDLPGFGDSDQPDSAWFSIPNYANTVYRFTEMMGLPAARVIGHSMGGLISLDFAATHPDRVPRLVVINPVVTGRAYLGSFAEWERGVRMLERTQRLSRRFLQPVLRHPAAAGLPAPLQHYRQRAEDFSRATAETLVRAGRAIVDYDVLPKLGHITAPTLIVLGTLDANVPNSEGHLAAVEIPSARLVAFPAAGHMVLNDRPAETAQLVAGFLP